MSEPVRFQYQVVPSSVRCSVRSAPPNIVKIALQVTNTSGHHVICPQIVFRLPTAHIQEAQGTVPTDPSRIVAAPGPRTPWAIFPGGDATWYATPLPPATGLEAG